MAKLAHLPDNIVIAATKGVLDWYVYRGVPCARTWPRRPAMPRSPASTASAAAFGAFAHAVTRTDPSLIALASERARTSEWTWKDLITAAAYGHQVEWQLAAP